MHLFLLNHGPNLILLWKNKYDGINGAGRENYIIKPQVWAEIGRETEAANRSIPATFIRPLPNIQTSQHHYTAESWSFWFIYIAPIVLLGHLPKKYYDHFLELVSIMKCLLELTNTTERINQLRVEIAGYVERFEKYYYQYDYDRLPACKLTLHALLHVADDVKLTGPPWASWSFSIERFCRDVTACVLSKVVPYSTVNKHILQISQLSAIAARFPEIRKALLFGKAEAPVEVSRMECIYPDYPNTVLRFPRLPGFLLKPSVRRRVAAFLRTNSDMKRTFHQWFGFIPERCERWGKLRIVGGDCIRSASAANSLSVYGNRDNSFVQFVSQEDRNARNRADPDMIDVIGYGRLDFILALTLPANPLFGIDEPQLHILAHVTEAKDATGDATVERVSYTKLGRSFVLDVTSIKRAVGRAETCGVNPSGE
ncbi:hypothetical protein FRC07_002590 [Ceratobasidium sp. 392]|nr:hypothetical protein FRC07_002590 [Ceratobasidium sp. 392]